MEKCSDTFWLQHNPTSEYTMGEAKLTAIKWERILGMIPRTITYKNKRILLLMYKTLIIPHLEYDVQAQSPHQLGHIRLIVGV